MGSLLLWHETFLKSSLGFDIINIWGVIMPTINMEYNEEDIKRLILQDLNKKMPGFDFNEKHIAIEVQSKQNFRVHEWEKGKLKITVDSNKIFAGEI